MAENCKSDAGDRSNFTVNFG